MAVLINTFVTSSIYNSLPHIKDVSDVPTENREDLEILRALLLKHDVPEAVSIRLIHKHYDALDGEVMVFDKVKLPAYGTVQTMRPVVPPKDSGFCGIHYFVNDQGALQAYEYATCGVPDTSNLGAFFAEFCHIVTERNLQHKFGLKIKTIDELDQTGWTEYELHAKRITVMFPDGIPQPQGDSCEVGHQGSDFTVTTEWLGLGENKRDNAEENYSEEDFCIGGHKVMPGTPVHEILNAVVEAY
ncbi:hypothetical protein KVR01_008454 [Diaporthe batatas]|uniref:uncharacterized protein n=1 Tax=Diaporthe batatas TaxID=748121 RepID=UPI001D056F3F|nr:uncharacterized protein KVR01_008454 [Diaporthe batatas]KAG8161467.1 hypothetical protein KVR01_008454 [Diaporthe batatas]